MQCKDFLARLRSDKRLMLITFGILAAAIIIIAAAIIAVVLIAGGSDTPAPSDTSAVSDGSADGSDSSTDIPADVHFPAADATKIRINGTTLYVIRAMKVGDLKSALNYTGSGTLTVKNPADVRMGDDDRLTTGMTLELAEADDTVVYTIEVLDSGDINDAPKPTKATTAVSGTAKPSASQSQTTTTQGGSNVNSNPNKEKYMGGHSVRDFGAKGDGKTDDTDAVNAAINRSVADGMPVYFPAGTYRVTRQIMMINGVTFYGTNVTDLARQAGSLPTLLIDQTDGPGVTMTAGGAIDGIQIKYNAGHTSKEPAVLCSSTGTRITDAVITNAYTGIEYAQSGNQNPGRGYIKNVIINTPVSLGAYIRETYDVAFIEDVTVNGSDTLLKNGVAFRFGHNDAIRIQNLTAVKANVGFLFDDTRVNGDVTGSTWGAAQGLRTQNVNVGIRIKSVSDEVRMNPISVMNSDIQANREALRVEHCRASASFSNVTFHSATATGIAVSGGDALMFSDCTITGKSTGVQVTKTGNLTMSSCKISASSVGV